jgi:WD40 repeat protein/serine/threonine protein kinase
MTERAIFIAALEKDDPAERAAYLDVACGGDAALRQRIERLLAMHEEAGSFLEAPPADPRITVDDPRTEGPGSRVGPYKLLQKIGEGGMGTVYMAEQQEPVRRMVALKIIKPGMDSGQVLARFEAERQALALMEHPNIARVLDAGTTETDRPYFVMELVKGIPITRFCDEQQLTPRERLELFVPVCQAVQHAHQKGIIHRDLKPSNILVALYDDHPVPKVIDFGVAKATSQRLTERTLFTEFGSLVGTLEYMSPEQARLNALEIDTRSDVYALGVLLYELLTGSTPLERKRLRETALDEVLRIIREEEPPRPSTRLSGSEEALASVSALRRTEPAKLGRSIRGELDWIVMKALEKDRSRRYESASGLARDVERYLHDEPVEACPPSAAYRLRKFARKNRTLLTTAVLLAAVLLMGAVVSTWQAMRANSAQREAVAQRNAVVANMQQANEERARVADANAKLAQATADLRRTLYASHLNLAQAAWDRPGGAGRVSDLLDQFRPKDGEPDLRGFEWHYWNRLCHNELLRFTFTGSFPRLSHDRRRLATWSDDGTIRVWDTATGRELLSCGGKERPLHLLGFSHDDRVLIGFANNLVALDAQTGEERWMHPGDAEKGFSLYPSPDGRLVITRVEEPSSTAASQAVTAWSLLAQAHCCQSITTGPGAYLLGVGASAATAPVWRTKKIWDAATGKHLCDLPSWTVVASSSDGQRLATGSLEGTVRLWDTREARELLVLKGLAADVWNLAFAPDGGRVAASSEGTVMIWDTKQGKEIVKLKGDSDRFWDIAFSPDGRRLCGRSKAGIQVWDTSTGREQFTLRDHGSGNLVADFSPDSRRLVTSTANGDIKVWDVEKGREIVTHRGYARDGHVVAFSSDGRRVISVGDDTVTVWDTERAPEMVRGLRQPHKVRSLAIHPAGSLLACGYAEWPEPPGGDYLCIRDIRTNQLKLKMEGHVYGVWDLAFSPDGARLASAGQDQMVKVWDTENGREVFTLEDKDEDKIVGGVGAVVWSPDGRSIATDSNGPTVKIWDTRTGRRTPSLGGHPGGIRSLAYSPDSLQLACASRGSVKIWSTRTGGETFTLTWPNADVMSLSYSPDGRYLAAGSIRGAIRLWDSSTGREVRTMQGHSNAINRLAFSPDGRRLASASDDQTVKLWDPATGQELLSLANPHPVLCVAFTPDGKQLAATCGNEVRIWDATPLDDLPPK